MLTLITGPAVEPVTLAEAKRHCRVDMADDDGLIADLIAAATRHCEQVTHRRFISQVWEDRLDAVPAYVWTAPVAPVLSIGSVTYVDRDGATQTWSSALYRTDIPAGDSAGPARLTPLYGELWPQARSITNTFAVRFTVGYGTTAASVPADIKAAIKLMVGHLYANREAVNVGNIVTPMPMAVDALLWPYKFFAGGY